MTRNQKYIFVLWVFGPLWIAGFLTIINPGFGAQYDVALESTSITGTRFLIGIQVLNAVFLYFRFKAGNRRVTLAEKTISPFLAKRGTMRTAIFAFILFVIPALWCSFMYPAIIHVLEEGGVR